MFRCDIRSTVEPGSSLAPNLARERAARATFILRDRLGRAMNKRAAQRRHPLVAVRRRLRASAAIAEWAQGVLGLHDTEHRRRLGAPTPVENAGSLSQAEHLRR